MPAPVTLLRADDIRVDPRAADPVDQLVQLFRADQVRLGQDQHGLDVALAHDHQVALEPAHVEIELTGLDDERHVDVGSDHLELDVPARGLPSQKRPARKYTMNDRVGP